MKITVITLSFVVLVAVVFSAPANFNIRNEQFERANKPGDHGPFPGPGYPPVDGQLQEFGPFGDNSTEEIGGPKHGFRFHFPTGMPCNGVQGYPGRATQQPGYFFRPFFGHGKQRS